MEEGRDVMSALEVARTAGRFSRMKRRELLSLASVGRGRAETMQAGSCVINLLTKVTRAHELVISPDGLREGALALFLHDRHWFRSRKLESATVERLLATRRGK